VLNRVRRAVETRRLGDGAPVHVVTETNFTAARACVNLYRVDLVVLDVRDESGSDHAGSDAFDEIRAAVFAPVVFHTAYASRVSVHAAPPVVTVVQKHEGSAAVVDALRAAVASGLPGLLRGVDDHVSELMRDYFWGHVAKHWEDLAAASAPDRAALLVQRLARSLEATRMDKLHGSLAPLVAEAATPWHPAQMYIVPPIATSLETGDLCIDPDGGHWVVLTPACDLAQCKADFVTVARARPLDESAQMEKWVAGAYSKNSAEALRAVLSGKNERYFYLPQLVHLVPDLLVDLQETSALDVDLVGGWRVVASLALPYAHVLSARYARYIGRLGYDDVPVDTVLTRLRAPDDTTASGANPGDSAPAP
jgi:hypothetical protein